MHTETLQSRFSLLDSQNVKRWLLVDSDRLKIGSTWRGIPIQAPSILESLDWSKTLLLVSTYGGQEAVVRAARKANVPDDRIVALYSEFRLY
jgi:hypothetical protein